MGLMVYGYGRTSEARRTIGAPGMVGCAGETLGLVSHEGVSAIVGEVAAAPEARLDVLRTFQSSVDGLHRAMALVPARFGAPSDEDEIRRFLMARDSHLRGVLDLVEGCDEWSVRVRLEVGVAEPVVLGPAQGTGGVAYLKRRKEAFELADGVPAGLMEMCRGELAPLIGLARATRLEGPGAAVTLPGVHLLVPRGERGELERMFGELVRARGGKVLLTGPWAVYSFVDARV